MTLSGVYLKACARDDYFAGEIAILESRFDEILEAVLLED